MKIADALDDSEEQRFLNRIHRITCREIRDEIIARTGETYLSLANGFPKNYIETKVGWDELGIKTTEECYTHFESGRPKLLSHESKNFIVSAIDVRSSSSRKVAREISEKTS